MEGLGEVAKNPGTLTQLGQAVAKRCKVAEVLRWHADANVHGQFSRADVSGLERRSGLPNQNSGDASGL